MYTVASPEQRLPALQLCRPVRRHLSTGVTVASAGILAAGLVALPPHRDARAIETQALRVTSLAATQLELAAASFHLTGAGSGRIAPSAASVAASTASEEPTSSLQQTIGAILFGLAFVGLIVVGGVILLPFTIVYQVQQFLGRIFGGPTDAFPAADAAASVTTTSSAAQTRTTARAGGRSARRSADSTRPTAGLVVAPSATAVTGGRTGRTTRSSATLPASQHAPAPPAASSRPAARAASATARQAPSAKRVGSERVAAR